MTKEVGNNLGCVLVLFLVLVFVGFCVWCYYSRQPTDPLAQRLREVRSSETQQQLIKQYQETGK